VGHLSNRAEVACTRRLDLSGLNGNICQAVVVSPGGGNPLSTGDLALNLEYNPFGTIVEEIGNLADRSFFRFSTKSFDFNIRAYYYGYRWHKAKLGRWLSRDPEGTGDTLNEYVMTRNAPQGYTDFLGRWTIIRPANHETITREALAALTCDLCCTGTPDDLSAGLFEGVQYPDIPDGLLHLAFAHMDEATYLSVFNGQPSTTILTHTGRLSYWHAMADTGTDAPRSIEGLPPGAQSAIMHASAQRLKLKIIERVIGFARASQRATSCRGKGYLLGQALHTIQDSWSRSHVNRNSDGSILRFQDYSAQDPQKHSRADLDSGSTEWNRAIVYSRLYLQFSMCPRYSTDLEARIRSMMDHQVLRFGATLVRVGGTGNEFSR